MVTIGIKLYREKLVKNTEEMISSAKLSFEKQNFPVAAFLSITAIEEISRIWYSLRFIHFMPKHDSRKEDRESLIQILESMEKEKTWQALSAKAKEAKQKVLDIIGPYTIFELDAKELRKCLVVNQARIT